MQEKFKFFNLEMVLGVVLIYLEFLVLFFLFILLCIIPLSLFMFITGGICNKWGWIIGLIVVHISVLHSIQLATQIYSSNLRCEMLIKSGALSCGPIPQYKSSFYIKLGDRIGYPIGGGTNLLIFFLLMIFFVVGVNLWFLLLISIPIAIIIVAKRKQARNQILD